MIRSRSCACVRKFAYSLQTLINYVHLYVCGFVAASLNRKPLAEVVMEGQFKK